jgi:hypothetical protein
LLATILTEKPNNNSLSVLLEIIGISHDDRNEYRYLVLKLLCDSIKYDIIHHFPMAWCDVLSRLLIENRHTSDRNCVSHYYSIRDKRFKSLLNFWKFKLSKEFTKYSNIRAWSHLERLNISDWIRNQLIFHLCCTKDE